VTAETSAGWPAAAFITRRAVRQPRGIAAVARNIAGFESTGARALSGFVTSSSNPSQGNKGS
jgi:hypothetical protein